MDWESEEIDFSGPSAAERAWCPPTEVGGRAKRGHERASTLGERGVSPKVRFPSLFTDYENWY